jgi:aminoglycoside/choline kinase family phosphotransferase
MSDARAAALYRLLEETGFAGAERVALAGDASTRRYERLLGPERRAILMDAPRSAESPPCPVDADENLRRELGWNATSRLAASRVEAFVAVAEHLGQSGLSTPMILGVDVEHGLAIVEDLGDDLFARVIEDGVDDVPLYCAAAEVLAHVHGLDLPGDLPSPDGSWPLLSYDRLALQVNADLFIDWIGESAREIKITEADRARFESIRDALISQALAFPRAFTIRDYHAENLLWLPDRDGLRRVGLLDFQDAVVGWRAWDFAMLLQDARRDVRPVAAEAAIARYLRRTEQDEAAFRTELAVLGAINALRILGRFAQLVHGAGKPRYGLFMPREWGHLNANLRHPDLAELRAFVREIGAPTGEFEA